MLTVDKHCEFLTAHIRDKSQNMYDGFKLFVQLFSALVAGAVFLMLNDSGGLASRFASLAEAVALLILVATGVIIAENARSWHEFRRRLSEVAGRNRKRELLIPLPKQNATTVQYVMFAVMVVATVAFWLFNPLRP